MNYQEKVLTLFLTKVMQTELLTSDKQRSLVGDLIHTFCKESLAQDY